MPVVQVPKNDNCSIGVHNGYPVCIKDIMNGSEFSRPKPPKKFSKEYEPTRGIEITEVVVTKGIRLTGSRLPALRQSIQQQLHNSLARSTQ